MADGLDLVERQLQQLQGRLEAMRMQRQHQSTEIAWRSEGLPLTPLEREVGMDDWFSDQHEDQYGGRDMTSLAALERQMDRLHAQDAAHGQDHERGMGY